MPRLSFRATLLKPPNVDGAYIAIDEAARAQLGGGGRIPVLATFNGAPYRGSVVKMGGGFVLGLNREVRAAAGDVRAGDTVSVTLERDDVPRTIELPPDLASALARVRGARAAFDGLAYTRRKELVVSIAGAKKPETRAKRIADAVRACAQAPPTI